MYFKFCSQKFVVILHRQKNKATPLRRERGKTGKIMSEYLDKPLPRFRYRGKPNGLLAEAADEDGTPIKVEWVYGFLVSETKYINHTGAHDYWKGMESDTTWYIDVDDEEQYDKDYDLYKSWFADTFGVDDTEDDVFGGTRIAIDGDTACVWTMFKDDKYRRIYVGDILSGAKADGSETVIGAVEYVKGAFRCGWRLVSELFEEGREWDKVFVSGNIFDEGGEKNGE